MAGMSHELALIFDVDATDMEKEAFIGGLLRRVGGAAARGYGKAVGKVTGGRLGGKAWGWGTAQPGVVRAGKKARELSRQARWEQFGRKAQGARGAAFKKSQEAGLARVNRAAGGTLPGAKGLQRQTGRAGQAAAPRVRAPGVQGTAAAVPAAGATGTTKAVGGAPADWWEKAKQMGTKGLDWYKKQHVATQVAIPALAGAAAL